MSISTRRLIAATSALDPASRAMLNLWLHRGLSDAQIAEFIGTTPEGVAARREALVSTLATELEASPQEVQESVDQLAASREDPPASEPGAESAPGPPERRAPAEEPPESGATVAPTGPAAVTEKEKAAEHEHEHEPEHEEPGEESSTAPPGAPPASPGASESFPEATAGRRRPSRTVVLIVVLALLALLLLISVLLAGSSKSTSAPKSVPASRAAPSAGTARSPRAAAPRPTPPRVLHLRPVGRATASAEGLVTLIRATGGVTRLRLTVNRLPPPPRAAVYGVWLYNSVLDAAPLAILRPAGRPINVRLPPRFARYRFVDVSVQPIGSYYHSGQSVLRAPLS